MKLVKKLFTGATALGMVLGMGTAVFAEDEPTPEPTPTPAPAYDQPLTITGLTEEDVAHFYKVIEWVGETDDDSDVAGWKAVEPFNSLLTKDKLIEILVGTPAVEDDIDTPEDESADAVPATGITAELAGQLAKRASGAGTEVTADEDGTATYENADAGLWMALITPADANTVYNPVFVAADYNTEDGGTVAVSTSESYSDEAAAKKSTLTLEKTASTTEDTWDDGESYTTAVGDTVSFEVTTTIPGYGEVYEEPHFVLTDTLKDLELAMDEDEEEYLVTIELPDDLTDDDYTITPSKTGFTIEFSAAYLKTLAVPTDVKVTYSAIVTSDAAFAVNEEDNEVYIEYSHDPSNESDYDVKKDTTQHYTFSIDAEGAGEHTEVSGKKTSEIVKIGVDAAGNPIKTQSQTSAITSTETWEGPLEGAVFGLFTDSAGEVPYLDEEGNAVTATSGADGRMNFKGLDAGTYYLKEISAPAGYVTDSTVHEVVITATTKEVEVTEWFKNDEWSSEDNGGKKVTYKTDILETYTVTIDDEPVAVYNFKNADEANSTEINWEEAELVEHPYPFSNVQGTELPSTGGMGTTIFYTIGGMLIIGAGILLVSRRRMAE